MANRLKLKKQPKLLLKTKTLFKKEIGGKKFLSPLDFNTVIAMQLKKYDKIEANRKYTLPFNEWIDIEKHMPLNRQEMILVHYTNGLDIYTGISNVVLQHIIAAEDYFKLGKQVTKFMRFKQPI